MYVPAEQSIDIFENRVKTQIDEFCKQWSDEDADLVKKLLLYVEKCWIGEKTLRNSRKSPLFAFGLWNKHEQTLNMQVTTNNAVEA